MGKNLNYTFKTILNNQETRNKQNKGAYFFEIQLTEEFLKDSFDVNEAFKNYNKEDIDIRTIHVPLTTKKSGEYFLDNGCLYLESLANEKYSNYFIKVCNLAQLFANHYKHKINVIIHNGLRLTNYLLNPFLLEQIIHLMNLIIDFCPDIIIEIENTTPLSNYDVYPYFTAGILFENIDIVNYLNEHCKKAIFKTVFDICHYLTSIRILKMLTGKEFSLKELFIKHEPVIGTIHFANLRNLGMNPGEHGCGYKEIPEDISLLKEILPLIDKYAYNADICLEITEKDYNNIPDVMETIRLISLIREGKI